ncbi:ComEC/Rec2-related protein [Alkaliphilus oremlandii OhILAs]|uniref:ComEC/Rec2-related protein n=2 Tax=Alkaliphilus oremlandii TaxID=461876 RepID=A8MFA0_ALKOO|nr:ComEC/Rec2-related protein [Alkaliphilus oremlandii OhILAs]
MKKPFISLFIAILSGISFAYFSEAYISIKIVLLMILFSLGMMVLHEKASVVMTLLTVAVLGAHLYGQGIGVDPLFEQINDFMDVKGKVIKEATFRKGYMEYEIEILSMVNGERNQVPSREKAQLRIYGAGGESVFSIDSILSIENAKITRLFVQRSKAERNDYHLYLKSKGMEYIVEATPKNISMNKDAKGDFLGIKSMSYGMKIYVEDFLDSTLDFENSDVLKSILFGNQGYLARERLDVFARTGTAHIIAVSGLHIGLIILITEQFLKLIKVGRNKRVVLTVGFLVVYGFMVYFPVSILRAGFMYILYVAAYFLERRYDSLNALFFIGFILLIYRPMTLFSVSFQLSFVATLSILLWHPLLNRVLRKKTGFLGELLSVTLAAQIGTLPLMAYHFQQISLISLATNIMILPLLAPMLSIALVSIVLGLFSFELGSLCNEITNQLLNYMNWISLKCAIIPYGSVQIKDTKLFHILIYYTVLAMIYYSYKNPQREASKVYEL